MTPPRRVPRLMPVDVDPQFYEMFGDLDPTECAKVALYVDREKRRMCVEMAVIQIGSELGFSKSKGFKLLKAGRYLIHQMERTHLIPTSKGALNNPGDSRSIRRARPIPRR